MTADDLALIRRILEPPPTWSLLFGDGRVVQVYAQVMGSARACLVSSGSPMTYDDAW